MSIFSNVHHYDNCLIFIDRDSGISEVAGMRARFADGLFELNYDGTDVEFTKHFKERFKSFYEKVLRDYDEALGYNKPAYEDCFDAMVADKTLIDYKPERTIYYFHSQVEKLNEDFNKLMREIDVVTLEDIFHQIADEWHKEAK